jgi:hypothetical protein
MYTIDLVWSDFKADIISKGFPLNYKTIQGGYEVFIVDRSMLLWKAILMDSADILDFETNYKTNANLNFDYDIEDIMFDSQEIRDTDEYNSIDINTRKFLTKTFIIQNSLDQTIILQLQASRDNTNWFNVGNSFDIMASIWSWKSCNIFFPYMRIVAYCPIAPTMGSLSIWCEKIR